MRKVLLALASLLAALAVPAHAREPVATVAAETGSTRFVPARVAAERQAIAHYGPFRVLDAGRAALVGVTDSMAPAQFAAMLRDHPALAMLELIECPGTEDDRANLELGRLIRAAGLATHVPRGGSVRSGAVELFLAGTERHIDEGAEFAVHSWIDEDGREAEDFAPDAAIHQPYLAYYREMGMEDAEARAFYAMTNAAPFAAARWLDASAMRRWLGTGVSRPQPRIAYLDLPPMLP
ncbi:alpha/beta hydrolase [Pelagerythrobacter rhizovicinus]|uniref:alpha/beta hydrolase n=1 Tax=Pelagerythrobacter rhizovicinus TaxID=2268576 RepID=UPI001CDD4034|nr:alpha/beta hydrolase [Pelagerythrobacter rhizovicinus]